MEKEVQRSAPLFLSLILCILFPLVNLERMHVVTELYGFKLSASVNAENYILKISFGIYVVVFAVNEDDGIEEFKLLRFYILSFPKYLLLFSLFQGLPHFQPFRSYR